MQGYVMVLAAVVLLALSFNMTKLYQQKTDTTIRSSVRYSILSGLVSFLVLLAANGGVIHWSWYSTVNALLKSVCGFVYSLVGYRIIAEGGVSLYTLFLMTGGMAVPAVFGWCFLGEAVTFWRVMGVVLTLVAVALDNTGSARLHPRVIAMCLLVFVLNGFVSVFSKLHQIHGAYGAVATADYALISSVITLAFSVGTYLWLSQRKRKAEKPPASSHRSLWALFLGVCAGVLGTVSSYWQLEGAKTLPASALYPMITGGSIVFSALLSLLFYRETITKRRWVGIALCVVGTCCFL